MIDAITGLSLDNPSQSVSAGTLDKDAFLQLLVAQIRYQNPLEPMDSQEYLAQTAQFAMVERIEEMAKSQTAAMSFQRAQLSSSLVGKQVTGIDPIEGEVVTGVVDSVAFNEGSPVLLVDGFLIGLENITSVAEAPEESSTTASESDEPLGDEPISGEPVGGEPITDEPITDEPATGEVVIPDDNAIEGDDVAESADGETEADIVISGVDSQSKSSVERIDRSTDAASANAIDRGVESLDNETVGAEATPLPETRDEQPVKVVVTEPVLVDGVIGPSLRPDPLSEAPVVGTSENVADESAVPPSGPIDPVPADKPKAVDTAVTEEQAIRFANLTTRLGTLSSDRRAALRQGHLVGSSRDS